jgi:hypothetical protein
MLLRWYQHWHIESYTNLFKTTLFSLFAGSVDATIGVTVKPVLNVQIFLLKALPVRSFTVLFIAAVYVVLEKVKQMV